MTEIPTYDADQLAGVLEILPGVDDIELKLTVSAGEQADTLKRLEIDSLDATIRQVAFVDTPDLRLSAAGVVVRARRTQHKPGDVTVKLRPILPQDVPDDLRGHPGVKIELDASPAGFTCSCSLTAEASDRKVRELFGGARELERVMDPHQRRLLADRLPEGVALGDLQVMGPIHLLKCKLSPEGHPRRVTAELWFLPDGSRILELSTKAPPAEAFQAAAETKTFLARRGIDLTAPQEAKTRAALAVFTNTRDHRE